jgi:sulfhydrogenase subunit beta (sulfur reductase)
MAAARFVLDIQGLQQLLDGLRKLNYVLIGPTVREGAIVYDNVSAVQDLPVGWTDEQDRGTYRLKKNIDGRIFGYTLSPQSWKRFLFPPVIRLWQANCNAKNVHVVREESPNKNYAFIGVRSCEIHAIAIQDKVFLEGQYSDPEYRLRRENDFIVAVNCASAGANCFCGSMETGPKATFGYDLALTEVLGSAAHYFIVDVGSERGGSVLGSIPHRAASEAESDAAEHVSESVLMRKILDTSSIKELLYRNYENPRWAEAADRCLTCGNCTLVCPTCFCSTVYDVTSLSADRAERYRKWDSCFTVDFSYIHGGSIRPSPRSRYRQWMVHKLGTWIDQFDTSGCVGCGRCITWCPVGIDITEEARAIRESEKNGVREIGGMKIANP